LYFLRKCDNIDIENDPLQRWLAWFDKNSPDELLEKVVKMDKAIMAANERQIYVSEDAELRRVYEMRELALMDERVSISDAREEGLERGLIKGREEGLERGLVQGREEGLEEGIVKGRTLGNIETARKLLQAGSKVEFVQEITGLSLEEIGKISI